MCDIPILYQDNRILVCVKPAGVISTDTPGGLPDLLRSQLGADQVPCLRTVHRLDQPVGGVMVLARSRMAARLLSQAVEARQFSKAYLAVLSGVPEQAEGRLEDLLGYDRGRRMAYRAGAPGRDARPARLGYQVLAAQAGRALVRVALETGRTHQIRAQFALRGLPLAGDVKYGGPAGGGLGLWSWALAFPHPQTGAQVRFCAPPPCRPPWTGFDPALWEIVPPPLP